MWRKRFGAFFSVAPAGALMVLMTIPTVSPSATFCRAPGAFFCQAKPLAKAGAQIFFQPGESVFRSVGVLPQNKFPLAA
jgi:hypothetical protein